MDLLNFRERALATYSQEMRGIEIAKQLDELGSESCPTGLVAGTQPGTIVAMEVLIKVDIVAPVQIVLELLRAAVDGSSSLRVAQENPGEPVRDLLADLEEVHQLA